jgi:hypothetical protein
MTDQKTKDSSGSRTAEPFARETNFPATGLSSAEAAARS